MSSEPTVSEYLKYANLQMAAEAFLVEDLSGHVKDDLIAALVRGNDHASKFTQLQAKNFTDHWQVKAQQPNTPSGFSGTLFECILDDPATGAKKGELVMSFRSTEFVDDSARDNQSTNVLEISQHGFAFGQIAEMEKWYADLKTAGLIPAGHQLDVTGYSLGGHLATVFNILHGEKGDASLNGRVVTFNGAGVGMLLDDQMSVTQVMKIFTGLRGNASASALKITDATLSALYERNRLLINAGGSMSADDTALLTSLAHPNSEPGSEMPKLAITANAQQTNAMTRQRECCLYCDEVTA
jgi:hypothetical protein